MGQASGRRWTALLRILWVALAALLFGSAARAETSTLDQIKQRGTLRWGADREGGAPYVFPDPATPDRSIGFEVDLAAALARELGVKAEMAQNAWDALIPALERGDFDLALNGIEVTPVRQQRVLFSRPYYVYAEQLVVRSDEQRINGMADLKGKKVGTLSGAVAQAMLEQIGGVEVKTYAGQGEPYQDLALRRIDAVLMDVPIAAYYAKPNAKLRYVGEAVGEGLYAIALRKNDLALQQAVDGALERLLRSGELKRIYEKWDLWDARQDKLLAALPAATAATGPASAPATAPAVSKAGTATLEQSRAAPLISFMPTLLRGAGVTLLISTTSMVLAIVLGLVLALMRAYGSRPLRGLATGYIEVYRGTPLLIQLFILYYGLPNLGLTLTSLVAAWLGLGMNYAAYEAEIYRAGLSAVPRGQLEAALSLGMTRAQGLRRIVLPQAFRIALPGITNDFIALFKDSSLVSIIALVELTKAYNMLASSTLRFFELGIVVAVMYFAMSYPLSLLARRLERSLQGGRR